MVDKYSPDLVILDIIMPEVDGFEVCRRLRQCSSVPVIVLSARGEIVDKVKCLNLGADDCIAKLGIMVYPSEDHKTVHITSKLPILQDKFSPQIISMASPKL